MKKLSILLFLLTAFVFTKAQYPIKQSVGNAPNTIVKSNAVLVNDGFVNGVFVDTTAANLKQIKTYPGAQIFTTSDSSFWLRNPAATRWLKANAASGSITSFTFLTENSLIVCYADGSCDTIPINNFTETVNNIVNNIIDSSANNVTFINDSTILICDGFGNCVEVDLGSTNNFFFINDSTVVTCDTPIVIQVGDDFVEQQLCDTISVPRQSLYIFQNGVQQLSPGIVVHGNPSNLDANPSALQYNTWLNTNYSNYNITGYPILKPTVSIDNTQGVYASGSVFSLHQRDGGNNAVGLYFNRTTPIWPIGGDTAGFMGRKKGYMIMTNAGGYWFSYLMDDPNAKQTGIMLHDRDTSNIDGVTIFAQQVPSQYSFGNTPSVDSTFESKRVAIFKTNQDVQFPNYPDSRDDGASPNNKGFYADSDGNLVYGEIGSGSITADQKRGDVLGTLYTQSSFSTIDTFATSGITPTISNSKVVLGNGTNNASIAVLKRYTMLTRWTEKAGFKVGLKNGNSYYFALGVESANTTFQQNIIAIFHHRSSPSQYDGFLELKDGSTYTNSLATSSTAVSFSQGDSIEVTLTRYLNVFTFTARNVTTDGATVSISYTYTGYTTAANTGRPIMIGVGSDSVYHLSFYSDESINSEIVQIGDSKMTWYGNTIQESIPNLMYQYDGTIVNHSGSGDKTAEGLLTKDEVVALKPKTVIISLGSNDIRNGISLATTEANLTTLYNYFTAAGIEVRFALMYETSVSQTALIAWLVANYPNEYIAEGYNSGLNASSTLLADNIHMNAYGNSLWESAVMRSGKLYVGTVLNTSTSTTHKVRLTTLGGSVTLAEGANTSITTTGDVKDAVVTISSLGGSSITIINDTTITICSFGDYVCDTFIVNTLVNPIQYVTVLNDSTLEVCDSLGSCDTLIISSGGGGGPGFDRGFFDPNQTSIGDTYHNTSGYDFAVGRNFTLSPTGTADNFLFGISHILNANATRNFVALNSNTVSGSENTVLARNMVVAGNTNFVAATDGQVFSTANYSATFGDAPINRGIAAITGGFGNKNWAENGFTMGSNNVNGSASPTVGTANLYSNSTVVGLQDFSVGSRNVVGGSFLFANNTSGDVILFGKGINSGSLLTATTTSSFNVGFGKTTPDFEITSSKIRINSARFEEYGGTTTAAANDLTLPNDGNRFTISGATTINAITTANWQDGSKVWFIFSGAPLVKNGTAGGAGTATILLAGRVDFQAAAGDLLYLGYNGTNWYEINRALAAGTATITADNGLTANTATNVQLGSTTSSGSPLLHDTYVNGGDHEFIINNSRSTFTYALQVLNPNVSGAGGIYATGQTFAIKGQGGNLGIYGVAPNYGVVGESTATGGGGVGVQGLTIDGLALLAQAESSTGTGVQTLVNIVRHNASPSNGMGASLDFKLTASNNTTDVSNQVISKYTDVTVGTRTSQLLFTGVNSASTGTILSINAGGALLYTVNTVSGTTNTLTATSKYIQVFTGSSGTTWTLPAIGNTGLTFIIKNRGSAAITLNSNAGGNDIYTTSAVNTLTINAGESYTISDDGTKFITY
jgi:acyl-CoA thioesterase I